MQIDITLDMSERELKAVPTAEVTFLQNSPTIIDLRQNVLSSLP